MAHSDSTLTEGIVKVKVVGIDTFKKERIIIITGKVRKLCHAQSIFIVTYADTVNHECNELEILRMGKVYKVELESCEGIRIVGIILPLQHVIYMNDKIILTVRNTFKSKNISGYYYLKD